jgi:hypothetical protein
LKKLIRKHQLTLTEMVKLKKMNQKLEMLCRALQQRQSEEKKDLSDESKEEETMDDSLESKKEAKE